MPSILVMVAALQTLRQNLKDLLMGQLLIAIGSDVAAVGDLL